MVKSTRNKKAEIRIKFSYFVEYKDPSSYYIKIQHTGI